MKTDRSRPLICIISYNLYEHFASKQKIPVVLGVCLGYFGRLQSSYSINHSILVKFDRSPKEPISPKLRRCLRFFSNITVEGI